MNAPGLAQLRFLQHETFHSQSTSSRESTSGVMRSIAILLALAALVGVGPGTTPRLITPNVHARVVPGVTAASPAEQSAQDHTQARLQADLTAVRAFRPAFPFWQHIFTIPDGRIIFGSAEDGRLLATFPIRGDWARQGVWEDPALARTLAGQRLPARLSLRREQVVRLLEPTAGPVVHNPTRGRFLSPNAERYGNFLSQWGAIYERFGVPAEIGLAQAIIESGLNGRVRTTSMPS